MIMETKETKLNGYTLPDELKKKMRDILYKTQHTKKEMGFTLCSKPDNIIRARGDHIGSSYKMVIDSRMCEKDEKFLGGYHTHFGQDSNASAEDLRYCGIFKITCTGGQIYEQPSVDEYNKMIYDNNKGITKFENPKYQSNFDCIRTIGSLFSDEKYIKEKLDKDLDKKELKLLTLNKSGASEREITEVAVDLISSTIKRDRRS